MNISLNFLNFQVCPNCRKHKFDSDSSDETLNIDKCSCSSIPNSLTNGDCHLNGIMESTNDNVGIFIFNILFYLCKGIKISFHSLGFQ